MSEPQPAEEEFRPRQFVRGLFRRYWPLLGAIVISMAAYSGFLVLRLGAASVMVDVMFNVTKKREVEKAGGDVAQVTQGRSLQAFEEFWRNKIGGQPPTEGLEEQGKFKQALIFFGISALVFSLLMCSSFYAKEFLAQKLVIKMLAELRQTLVDRLVLQSLSFFHRQKAGDLLSRVTNDVHQVNMTLRMIFETLVQEPLAIISALSFACWISPKLTLIVMPFYLALFIPIARSGRKVKRYGKKSLQKLGEVTEDLQQLFTGIRTVKAFGMEGHERRDFREKNKGFVRKALKTARAKITGRTFQELGYNSGTAVFIVGGAWLLYTGQTQLDAGQWAGFLAAMVQMYQPIKSISRAWSQLQESKGGYDRLLELMRARRQVQDAPGAVEFPGIKREVRFSGVSFAYNGSAPVLAPAPVISEGASPAGQNASDPAPVLRDVSFEVTVGQMVAIVGPSGAGKSTLLDLLARFYDPQEGAITVDGRDVRSFRHSSWLKSVAIVSQDPFLFNATIEENIAYGRVGASREEVEAAARQAYAHDFILEQPNGYETRIGERGMMLSGGQRQRLTIARAILKDAPILILDEATSSLDSAAEKEVQKALENLLANRTTFTIAHRLSTILHAAKIIVLREGRIVEEGTHKELLARRGPYWELYRLQDFAA